MVKHQRVDLLRIGRVQIYRWKNIRPSRLRKLACPRVNDDQKIHVGDQKLSPGRPHDYWILKKFIYG